MKITLAFCAHNVEATIEGVLGSWLDTLSGQHEVEVISVFDGCTDNSVVVAHEVMAEGFASIDYIPFATHDIWEVKANNLALQYATGDAIIFAQGDNWMHTPHWDDALATLIENTPTVGAIGLLAGVGMNRDFSVNRIECYTPEKERGGGWVHGLGRDTYPLGVYEIDAVIRPFAVRTDLLRPLGGLDEAYCPMDWDDADLSFKLALYGFTNLYLPLNVLNTSSKQQTLTSAQMNANFQHGERVARERWGRFVADTKSSAKLLYPMQQEDDGRLSV